MSQCDNLVKHTLIAKPGMIKCSQNLVRTVFTISVNIRRPDKNPNVLNAMLQTTLTHAFEI